MTMQYKLANPIVGVVVVDSSWAKDGAAARTTVRVVAEQLRAPRRPRRRTADVAIPPGEGSLGHRRRLAGYARAQLALPSLFLQIRSAQLTSVTGGGSGESGGGREQLWQASAVAIDSRVRGDYYSTCISFGDRDEVEKAFDELDGQEAKDSSGRLQKNVLLKRDNGDVASFYVRKMAYGAQLNKSELSNKRPPPTEHVEPTKEDNDGDKQKKRKTGKKHEKKKAKISVAE
ncbi:hypothetical protein OsI_17705 [Oryza sativa Indica Group]|uniref:Uncharacterized protein n=1 Tax=Oryza sativa subsp. indica TaxID=39946 RepID=B8AVM9_ORYSI|nr:hypothetical protein OsI_17705 [Oryza sativa Indica Group]